MEIKHIKNIEHATILPLKDQVQTLPGMVVSKTLVQNSGVGITLFAFDSDQQISAHDSKGDAMVLVLEGEGIFTIQDQEYRLKEGETIIMPANIPHAVYAPQAFKMLLTVVF